MSDGGRQAMAGLPSSSTLRLATPAQRVDAEVVGRAVAVRAPTGPKAEMEA